MNVFFIFTAIAHLLVTTVTHVFNHLLIIPLTLFLGVGKYVAFVLAVTFDQIQLNVYTNIFENARWARRFQWLISKKLVEKYTLPHMMRRMKNSWAYFGLFLLACLPTFLGGMFIVVFTAHTLHLNRTRSYICITLGSIVGCFIWTLGMAHLITLFMHLK